MKTSLEHLASDPNLRHPRLTPNEMAMICDVCNPGFEIYRDPNGFNQPGLIAAAIRSDVFDSFILYPGSYEDKWEVDRREFERKLNEMTDEELNEVARKVDVFWAEAVAR